MFIIAVWGSWLPYWTVLVPSISNTAESALVSAIPEGKCSSEWPRPLGRCVARRTPEQSPRRHWVPSP